MTEQKECRILSYDETMKHFGWNNKITKGIKYVNINKKTKTPHYPQSKAIRIYYNHYIYFDIETIRKAKKDKHFIYSVSLLNTYKVFQTRKELLSYIQDFKILDDFYKRHNLT